MTVKSLACAAGVVVALFGLTQSALAQPAVAPTTPTATPTTATRPCKELQQEVGQPAPGSPDMVRCIQVVAHPVDETTIPHETYIYRLTQPRSLPNQGKWVAYDEKGAQTDFWNLWRLGFLDNIWVEVVDEPFENGVIGKHIVYHIEERQRVKVIDYDGSKQVDIASIEELLDERNLRIRTDTFADQTAVRKVKGVIQELYGQKGYNDAQVEPIYTPLAGGPNLVQLTFNVKEGPKYKIREIGFEGNSAFSDRKLRGQMKENKQKTWLSFILGSGTYQDAKFAEDAEAVENFYQNEGYVKARVGTPQVSIIEDSRDGKSRWIRVSIPVDEGQRYRIGKLSITGTSVMKPDALLTLTKLKTGDYYNREKLNKAFQSLQEVYGTYGFYEWTPLPKYAFPNEDPKTDKPLTPDAPAVVDLELEMQEGPLYHVNRITFTGNSTTRDNVIRREMRVYEAGVFNMKALQDSIRRLNQLGYFKPFEGKEGEWNVETRPDHKVDIKLKFEEQNRNQLAFGAGVSQFDGFFGQLSFQTSNFLGRGETLGVSLQRGSQARQYQIAFSEPYLFDRPITVGVDLHKRQYIFPIQFTQDATGGNFVVGFPVSDWSRIFLGYSYEQISVYDINPRYLDPNVLANSPALRDSLLIGQGGRRKVSKVSPSYIFNTVNEPIFPSKGTRYTAALDVAGIGGNTEYLQARSEGIWYVPLTRRMSLGLRAEAQYIRPYGSTTTLPIFEKLFLGGEYTIRGFDIRSVAPRDPNSGLLTGGNKTMVFNAEYYINIVGPVRLLFFYDAGQVRNIGESFRWNEDILEAVQPPLPPFFDPTLPPDLLLPPGEVPAPTSRVIGRGSAFRTSTGAEIRFFMPVLNVPFRLIAAYNPQRRGIFDNNLRPQQKFTFRFAVGTTF
jgi:outer membrane protein insertion porin family